MKEIFFIFHLKLYFGFVALYERDEGIDSG